MTDSVFFGFPGEILDAVPLSCICWDEYLDPVFCNNNAVRMFNADSKESLLAYLSRKLNEDRQLPGADKRLSLFNLQNALDRGRLWVDLDIQTVSGETIPSDTTIKRLDYGGESYLLAVIRDASGRLATWARTKESEERLQILFDTTPMAIQYWEVTAVNPNGTVKAAKVVDCNQEAVHMFGLGSKEELMKRFFDLSPDYQPDGANSYEKTLRCLSECPREGYLRFEWMNMKPDGEELPTEITLARIKHQQKTMIAGYIRDLREHEAVQREMRRVEIAEESNKLKNKFLATISHEIRTPMNSILGITEIQLLNEKLPEETREALGRIYSSGNLLLHIVNDILDMSKIEAGKLELIISPYQTASLINDSVQMNILQYESKPIEFKLKVSENIPVVLDGDELRIKQIVNNLLSNAFKYTDKGHILLVVDTQPHAENDEMVHLIFSIRDTGQGMTEEQVRHLFDEYSRFNLEANRMTVGTGLGMSITNNLIKMMNGAIDIESEPGKGTVFTVRLPQRKADAKVIGREIAENLERFRFNNPASQVKTVQIVREPMPYGKVLLVDDMETNLYVGKGLLTPYGIQVETAVNGMEAVHKVESGQAYDIIFMDHMMPVMDGIEATQKIRAMGYTKPIVALTANAIVGQAEIFLQNGIDDFIPKPIDTRRLNQILNRMIRDVQPPEVIEAARSRSRDIAAQNAEAVLHMAGSPLTQSFMRDAEKTVEALEEAYAHKDCFTGADMQNHIIHAHAIKSALANMGETALSKRAAILEEWGRMGNTNGIFAEIPAFLSDLKAYTEKLAPRPKNAPARESAAASASAGLTGEARAKWMELRDACNGYNKKAARKLVADLTEMTREQKYLDALDLISQHLLHSAFPEAGEAASSVL